MRKWISIAAGVVVALLIAASIFAVRLQPWARATLIDSLKQRYKAGVELGDLRISLFPRPRVTGENLVIHPEGGAIRIRRFTASIIGPKHIRSINLEGLDIKLPPRHGTGTSSASSSPKISMLVDEVVANEARLTTTPKDPSKQPLVFDLHHLTLHRVGSEDAMTFHTEMTNPRPHGIIVSDGTFGPWNADEPTDSPVEGKYTFRDADLSVFNGIRGILNSTGSYKGHLDSIDTQGVADVANFALRIAGNEVPLHTEFHAMVDGTDGDTILRSVHARLGKSEFEVSGAIDKGELEQHKTILLSAQTDSGRLEDFLRLAIKNPKAPMTGGIRFNTIIKIPPGDVEVIERLELDGTFGLGRVKFNSPDVEEKISNLSHRAQGDPNSEAGDVVAAFSGHFQLRDGTMHLPDLTFRVPGALIALAGTYQMRGGALDFSGTAKLDATVSQMTTGVKKILLKPVDPLFQRKDAGAVVPIRITGTPGQPSFGLDIGRALRKK